MKKAGMLLNLCILKSHLPSHIVLRTQPNDQVENRENFDKKDEALGLFWSKGKTKCTTLIIKLKTNFLIWMVQNE